MYNDIEENIRKNLIIYLSHHCCKFCFKPYSNATIVEIDDLAFIFAEKMFYKLDCSIRDNSSTIKKSISKSLNRPKMALLNPYLGGNIMRFGVTCLNCWGCKFLEWNMSKFDGTKNYLNSQ